MISRNRPARTEGWFNVWQYLQQQDADGEAQERGEDGDRGMSLERARRVYQESGGVEGEITPLGRGRGMGAMGKQPEMFQKKGNGWSPSVT